MPACRANCLLLISLLLLPTSVAIAENEGLEKLDEAMQLKVTAEGVPDLNKAIDLLDTALEEGLDVDNTDFAEQLLVASLIQRAQALASAILDKPLPNPRQDPRWVQIRQFALSDLQRSIALDNSQWDAHLLLGRLQVLPLGDPNAARRALTLVVRSDGVPDRELAQAHALRGAVQRDGQARLDDFSRAIELQPDKPEFLRLRVQQYLSSKNYDKALVDVDRVLELQPEDAGAHQLRGMVLLGQDKLEEALASFDKAGELAPDAILPYQHRGELFRRKGDFEESIKQLSKALEVAPDDPATLLIRAAVYQEAMDPVAALADVDRLLAKQPGLLKGHQMKAEILAASDRLPEAISHLERIVKMAPNQSDLQYQLATYYLIAGQPRQAVDRFTLLLQRDPDNLDLLRSRGDAYLNIGKHREAIADFELALGENEEDQRLLNNLAWVLATSPDDEFRDGERAIELAKKACELTAYETPHILSTLAAAFAETGDFDEAVKWSAKAVELGADDPNHDQLASELASYEQKKPWRELQVDDATPEAETPTNTPGTSEQSFAPPSAVPAPARTLDF